MKLAFPALVLVLVLLAGCGPAPNSGTLRDALFSHIANLNGTTGFTVQRNTLNFEFRGDRYVCEVIASTVEPIDDKRYTHIGTLDCAFTMNGEPLEFFDPLTRAGIESDAIIAAWDNDAKRWRFDLEFDFD